MKKYFYHDKEITEEEARAIEEANAERNHQPTKSEVFGALRCAGCTWCGGHGCECYSRTLKECYERAEKDLIRQEETKNKVYILDDNNANDAQAAFDDFWEYLNN